MPGFLLLLWVVYIVFSVPAKVSVHLNNVYDCGNKQIDYTEIFGGVTLENLVPTWISMVFSVKMNKNTFHSIGIFWYLG